MKRKTVLIIATAWVGAAVILSAAEDRKPAAAPALAAEPAAPVPVAAPAAPAAPEPLRKRAECKLAAGSIEPGARLFFGRFDLLPRGVIVGAGRHPDGTEFVATRDGATGRSELIPRRSVVVGDFWVCERDPHQLPMEQQLPFLPSHSPPLSPTPLWPSWRTGKPRSMPPRLGLRCWSASWLS